MFLKSKQRAVPDSGTGFFSGILCEWNSSECYRTSQTFVQVPFQILKQMLVYDAAVAEFKELVAKRDAMRKDKLMDAFVKSGKTYEEVLAFLQEDTGPVEEKKPKKSGGNG